MTCPKCDRPIPTTDQWRTTPPGEGKDFCWDGYDCSLHRVNWRARALAAEEKLKRAEMPVGLEELDALYEAVTKGEWIANGEDVVGPEDPTTPRGYPACERIVDCRSEADAKFIAAIHSAWPKIREMLKR